MCRKNGDNYEVVGVVSFGVGCNSTLDGKLCRNMFQKHLTIFYEGEKLPGVYARVSEALDWIEETVSDGQCK